MAISRVGSAVGTNTATVPTHAIGDLILCFSFRDGSTTSPGTPSGGGFQSAATKAGTSCAGRLSYKIATATNDSLGTSSNASRVVVVIYRPTSGNGIDVGDFASNAGTSNTTNFPALTMQDASGASWVAGFIGHRSINEDIETPPTGMSFVDGGVDATAEADAHDTNAGVSSWSSTNRTSSGTASGWVSFVVEVKDVAPVSLGAFSLIQSKVSADLSNVASFSSAVQSGNFVWGLVSWDNAPASPITSVTDDKGNSYNLGTAYTTADNQSGQIFWLGNITNAPTTITINFGGAVGYESFLMEEWSGVAALADPSDGTIGAYYDSPSTATDAITSTNITTTVDGDLILGATYNSSGIGYALDAGTGFTTTSSDVTVAASSMRLEAKLQTTAGSVAATFTDTTGDRAGAFVLAAKPSGGTNYPQTVNITAPSSLSLVKSTGKIVSFTGPSSLALSKATAKFLSFTAASTLSLKRETAKALAITATAGVSLKKATSTFLAITAASSLSIIAQKTRLLALSITSGSALALSKVTAKTLPITASASLLLNRAVDKIAVITGPASLTLNRVVGKFAAITAAASVTIASFKTRLVSLSISAASSVTLARSVTKQLSVAAASSLSIAKGIGKSVSVVAEATVARLVQIGKAVSIAAPGIVSLQRVRALVLAITSSSTVSHALQIGKGLVVTGHAVVDIAKHVDTLLAIVSLGSVSIIYGRSRELILTIVSDSNVALSRQLGKVLAVASASSLTVTKHIDLSLRVISASIMSIVSLVALPVSRHAVKIIGSAANRIVSVVVSRASIIGKQSDINTEGDA